MKKILLDPVKLYISYIIDKKSIRQIAKIFQVGRSTVLRNLYRCSIQLRHGREAHIYNEEIKGNNHYRFKGFTINAGGYVLIYSPNHPYRNKQNYVYEHRLVMEKHLERYLTPMEVVHHNNGTKNDNRIFNLTLFATKAEHTKHHKKVMENLHG